ncbi:adp-ribose pyrophosphatase [Anaeramoeba flamelloides]|uniref:Adp-ribose pyrophosphatase n=1 Tax=Anaeramoeba flamelloides TaxID=1746091 RepID=A0ABQ8XQ76_9EUKA|nr:adp-ribose pyrophosphatase [Anaeramoeba flamelloides]
MSNNDELTYLEDQLIYSGKSIDLKLVTYKDPKDITRSWEFFMRKPEEDNKITQIIGLTNNSSVVLLTKHQPIHNKPIVQFPLTKGNEIDIIEFFKKETGLTGTSPTLKSKCAYLPCLTKSTLFTYTLNVNLDDQVNKQSMLNNVSIWPLGSLFEKIEENRKNGSLVDASVEIWSIGLQFSSQFNK